MWTKALTISSIVILLIFFQNCAPSFESASYSFTENTSTFNASPTVNSCNSNVEVPKRRMRLLSKKEYSNTVKSILGKLPNSFTESPLEGIFDGYTNYADNLIVSETVAQIFFDNSLLIANEILENNMFEFESCLAKHDTCNHSIKLMLETVFRGYPIDTVLIDKYLKFYVDQFNLLETKKESLIIMLAAVFQAPQFIYRSELGIDTRSDLNTLKPYELANQLSYLFTHSPPDKELLKDLKNKTFFAGSPKVKAHALRLSEKSNTLNVFIENWLELGDLSYKTKKFALPGSDNNEVLRSLAGELNLLTKKIIDQNLNYKDMHSLQSTFVNANNSKIYVDHPQPNETYKEVTLNKRKGILSMAPFLVAHSNPDNSNPIHRGAFVLRKIMCGKIQFPKDIGALGEEPVGEQFTTRQLAEASTEKPGCINCHVSFNGYGFALESFNEWGLFREKEAGQNINTETTMIISGKQVHIKDSVDLSNYISTSSDAQSCFAKNLLTYSLSMEEPDTCFSDKIKRSLATGASIKEVFLSIINTDQFTKRKK